MRPDVVVEDSGHRSVVAGLVGNVELGSALWRRMDLVFFSFLFSLLSHTCVDGLTEFACYFGQFGFAGSGEEVAAGCAE